MNKNFGTLEHSPVDNSVAHTPGPWWVEPDDQNWGFYVVHPVCEREECIPTEEDEANARLIAAAPFGLELAYAIKSFLEDRSNSERRRDAIHQATIDFIAKATSK